MTARADYPCRSLVLVLDDEPTIHQSLGTFLQRNGFATIHAHTVTEGINAAKQHLVQAVVLDIHLPLGESGMRFLEWLRGEPVYAATPVLVLTGDTMLSHLEEDTIRQHRAHIFYKPESYAQILDYLRRLIVRVQ